MSKSRHALSALLDQHTFDVRLHRYQQIMSQIILSNSQLELTIAHLWVFELKSNIFLKRIRNVIDFGKTYI